MDIGLVQRNIHLSTNGKGEYTEKENGGSRAAYWYVSCKEQDNDSMDDWNMDVKVQEDMKLANMKLQIPQLINKENIPPHTRLCEGNNN